MEYIQLSQITKYYDSRKVLDQVEFSVQRGTVVALVGENGAGKSTLMNIFGGLTLATEGHMRIAGKPYSPQSAEDAFSHRIGFVHQHFLLADHLTALENLILNTSSLSFSLAPLPKKNVRQQALRLLNQFKWQLDLNEKVESLSVGDQQRIEILKSLLQEPEILILDEPTAVLSPLEIEKFLEFITELKKLGKTIFLITHKLPEVEKIADQVVILRGGKLVHNSLIAETHRDEISEKIVGKKLVSQAANRSAAQPELLGIEVPDSKIQLKKGEIFGVAGVEGNGQSELIGKILKAIKKSEVSFADITEDRLKLGIFPGLNLQEHMILRHTSAFSKYGFIQHEKVKASTEKLLTQWNVRPADVNANILSLSGGNQQKFVIGKELWHNPDFILAAHPTRGVDLGAQEQIHQSLLERRNLQKTVFLITADLDEVLKLSDRYIILYKNKIYGPFQSHELSEKDIGEYMTGIRS